MDKQTGRLTFGRWLQEARKALRLTQEELGRRAGYSTSYVSTLERGEPHTTTGAARQPSRAVVQAFANALSVPETEALMAAGYLPDGQDNVIRIERDMTPEDGEFLRRQFSSPGARVVLHRPDLLEQIVEQLDRIERKINGRSQANGEVSTMEGQAPADEPKET